MANRSYLYSCNLIPSRSASAPDRQMTGISEWRYDIPIVFKVLVSGNPRKCPSSIWKVPEEIAIVGEYDQGLDRLLRFLEMIPFPEVAPLKDEARRFLTDRANRNHYFVLECGEVFEMEEAPLAEQNDRLLAEVQDIETLIDSALANLLPPPPATAQADGLFSRLLRRKPVVAQREVGPDAFHSLGLGNWSNVLYFDLRQPE